MKEKPRKTLTIPQRRDQLRRRAEAAYERGDRDGALNLLEQAVAIKRAPLERPCADGSRVADALVLMEHFPKLKNNARGAARYVLALDHSERYFAAPKNKRPKGPTRDPETRINALAQSIRRRLKMLQK